MSGPRRAYGEGSISFDTKTSRWVGRIPLPPGPDGQRRRSRPVYGNSRQEVAAKLEELRGGPANRTTQTVAQYLTWYTDTHLPTTGLDPATIRSYRQNMKLHVSAHIGGLRLANLEPEHLSDLKAAWAKTCAAKAHSDKNHVCPGLAVSTRKLIWAQLRSALDVAEEYKRLGRNWARVARGPRGRTSEKGAWLEPAEALKLLSTTAGGRMGAYYPVGVALGMRIGEACGLEWRHIDLDAATIRIEQQIQRTKGGWQIKPLKGRAWGEHRDAPLPKFVVSALREHRRLQLEERLANGWTDPVAETPTGRRELDLVFRTAKGQPWHRNEVARQIERACEDAGIDKRAPHDMRRSFASFLAAKGVPLSVAMEIGGWSSPQVLLAVYQRATKQGLLSAADAMDSLLGLSAD